MGPAMNSRIVYSKNLVSSSLFPEESLLFYDSALAKHKFFKLWAGQFKCRIPLKAGESLKTLASLEKVLNKISKLNIPQTTGLTFIAACGGSVGDFTGFLASIFLRGRDLVLLPSTWLSAVDSAHGGKNGLNFQKSKNQIGTFYPAKSIYLIEELLMSQPQARLQESMGEIIKTAILFDRKLFAGLEKNRTADFVLSRLPVLIGHKNKIVAEDPFEKKGLRRILNLGHTMGHVFESYYGWPHGICVLLGLQFSARWSFFRKELNQSEFFRISMLIDSLELKQNLNGALQNLKPEKMRLLLSRDKKTTSAGELDFIFIQRIGKSVRCRVTLSEILAEAARQKLEY